MNGQAPDRVRRVSYEWQFPATPTRACAHWLERCVHRSGVPSSPQTGAVGSTAAPCSAASTSTAPRVPASESLCGKSVPEPSARAGAHHWFARTPAQRPHGRRSGDAPLGARPRRLGNAPVAAWGLHGAGHPQQQGRYRFQPCQFDAGDHVVRVEVQHALVAVAPFVRPRHVRRQPQPVALAVPVLAQRLHEHELGPRDTPSCRRLANQPRRRDDGSGGRGCLGPGAARH